MTILIGKHIDQAEFDSGMKIRTLPVLLGNRAARTFNIILLVLIYAVIAALIWLRHLTPFAAIVAILLPRGIRTIRVMNRPRPSTPPTGYVGWPLWYHRACLQHNRLFGWIYISGLAAGAIWTAARG